MRLAVAGIVLLVAPLASASACRPEAGTSGTATATASAPASTTRTPASSATGARGFAFEERIGTVSQDLEGPLCMKLSQGAALPRGTSVTIVVPPPSGAVQMAEVTGTCEPGPDPAVVDGRPVPRQALRLVEGTWTPGVGLGIVEAPPVTVAGGEPSGDLDRDGTPETFTACTSAEGLHLNVWSGNSPEARRRRWHGYHYLGYDVEPTCTEAETALDAEP